MLTFVRHSISKARSVGVLIVESVSDHDDPSAKSGLIKRELDRAS